MIFDFIRVYLRKSAVKNILSKAPLVFQRVNQPRFRHSPVAFDGDFRNA